PNEKRPEAILWALSRSASARASDLAHCRAEAVAGALEVGLGGGAVFGRDALGQPLAGALLGRARALNVDLRGRLGRLGHHDHAVVEDLDEAAAGGEDELVPVRERDVDRADAGGGQHGRVVDEDLERAVHAGGAETGGLAPEGAPVRRDDLDVERHSISDWGWGISDGPGGRRPSQIPSLAYASASIFSPASITSSMAPL